MTAVDLNRVYAAKLAQCEHDSRPVAAYLASLGSEVSRAGMVGNLRRAVRELCALSGADLPTDPEYVPWQSMTPAHMTALAARLGETYSPATCNVTLAAVRGVLRSAWNLGMLDRERLERLARDANGRTHAIRGTSPERGRHLGSGELAALFRAAAADEYGTRGARDAALLAILDGGGLRRAEAVALDLGDVDFEAEALTVRRGKGRKARTVPLASGATAALSAWINQRGSSPGALLLAVNRGGRILGSRLSTRAVQRSLDRLAAVGAVEPFTAHDFRRTVAGDLLEAGADIVTVQHLLGHANPNTTARYDRRPAEARRKAARLRAVPYRAAA